MSKIVKRTQNPNIVKVSRSSKAVNTKLLGVNVDTTRFKKNQSPVESPDGSTVAFTLPNSDYYTTGQIEVYVNGNLKIKDTEWEETGTAPKTQITFIGSLDTTPPAADEVITLNYIK